MKYAVELGSGAIMYIPNFRNTDSGIQKLIPQDMQTYRQHSDLISLLYFFKIRKVG
jgi:hypothetical protein